MSEAAYSQKVGLILEVLTFFIIFYVGSGPKAGSGTGTVIHSGTGFAKAVTDPQETFILQKKQSYSVIFQQCRRRQLFCKKILTDSKINNLSNRLCTGVLQKN
jgi:hypothetical protein